ncbi:hypothetical protein H5410_059679, partial [Solanum commersonii]
MVVTGGGHHVSHGSGPHSHGSHSPDVTASELPSAALELPIPSDPHSPLDTFEAQLRRSTRHRSPWEHRKSDVYVLSLGRRSSWRRVGEVVYHNNCSKLSRNIMLNGKMHWLTLFGNDNKHCDRLIV